MSVSRETRLKTFVDSLNQVATMAFDLEQEYLSIARMTQEAREAALPGAREKASEMMALSAISMAAGKEFLADEVGEE